MLIKLSFEMPARSAASSYSFSLAVVAAFLNSNPTDAVESLPNVPGSHGHKSVSPRIILIFSGSMHNSSATAIIKPVFIPWP